jgi:hypothetical protein
MAEQHFDVYNADVADDYNCCFALNDPQKIIWNMKKIV